MKIHMEFNSLAELLNTSKTLSGGLTPSTPVKKDKNIPLGATSWEGAYAITLSNLERAYERIREFNDLKKNNPVIRAEFEKINRKLEAEANAEYEALAKDSIDNLRLPERAHKCLRSAEIYTISDLLNKTETDLMRLNNFGRVSLRDVKAALKTKKLSLKGK